MLCNRIVKYYFIFLDLSKPVIQGVDGVQSLETVCFTYGVSIALIYVKYLNCSIYIYVLVPIIIYATMYKVFCLLDF